MKEFWFSLLHLTNEMSPYLLLGFLVAGILHTFVPKKFYTKYLSKNDFSSVAMAALLGVPLPLCSCGVIPTAVGLRNEKASKGAVASFLIATPQTGIDSIIATFSLMGLAFAIVRPVAALVTGLVGGFLVTILCKNETTQDSAACQVIRQQKGNPVLELLRYAFVDMMRNIGGRLVIGLLLAALIQVAVPDTFFLQFGSMPLLQMAVMLLVAVPMYVCSTGSIPIAAALLAKGLSPGAALVLLMAGPAVNLGSMMVVKKTMGSKFTAIYVSTVVAGAVLFGLLFNNIDGLLHFTAAASSHCCSTEAVRNPSVLNIICSVILLLSLLNVFIMSMFNKFKKQTVAPTEALYGVEGMSCNHCKMAVETAVSKVKGVENVIANLDQKTVKVDGTADEKAIRKAIEDAGFLFKGKL